jgi:ketosteroid isomerase-like protein
MTTNTDATEVTHRFIEALNARDTDELTDLVAEDAQFRTAGGKALIGHDGVEKLVTAARATGVMFRRLGDEMVTEEGDTVKVVVRVEVTIQRSDLAGTAELELRDGKVAAFDVVTQS